MDLEEFKKEQIRSRLGIVHEFGKILSIVDFGNANHWFEEDRQDHLNRALASDEKLAIDLKGLKEFCDSFSSDVRFYYGHDAANQGSLDFLQAIRGIYGKHRLITKQMQMIRHHLSQDELVTNTRQTHIDGNGEYIRIPKCNFDVEIAVDAMRLMERYDTLCLFSGDADFVQLARYLKKCGKKIIIVKGGHIVRGLKEVSNLVVNAQSIKEYIAIKKQKPGG